MKRRVNGTCISLSIDCKAIIKVNKDFIFDESLLLVKETAVEITYTRTGVSFGKIKKLLSFLKERILYVLLQFHVEYCFCQNTTYEYELNSKRNKVKEDLKCTGGFAVEVDPVIGMDKFYYYCNKIQGPFVKGRRPHCIWFSLNKCVQIIFHSFKNCYIESKENELIFNSIAT